MVEKRRAQLTEKAGITAERVLEEMVKVGMANMADYYCFDGGRAHIDFAKMPASATAAIMEIQQEEILGDGDEVLSVRRTRLKLHSKIQALNSLGKHFGLFPDKVDVSGTVEIEPISNRELGRQLAYVLRQAEKEAKKVIEHEPLEDAAA